MFVDFDGVLRRDGSPRERLDADCVERFADCVLAHDAARVVIASVETYLKYAEAIGLTATAAAPHA